jgi:hypothetical protein
LLDATHIRDGIFGETARDESARCVAACEDVIVPLMAM